MVNRQVDILIIGGGLTGATLMLALADMGYSTLLVEAKPFSNRIQADFDARSLALAPATVRILQMLGVWSHLEAYATPIDTIHVSEQRSFGSARLQGEQHAPMGHVVEMQYINKALHHLLDHRYILAPTTLVALDDEKTTATIQTSDEQMQVQAKLIVAADGADSCVRQLCGLATKIKDYDQQAIIANIGLARPHHHYAYERFTSSGPLAMLPLTNARSSLVWALRPKTAAQLMAYNEAEFLKALQKEFGYRLGRFVKMGQRVIYPLRQVVMTQQIKGSVVFVGNAAHTLHPVAGQGFNLGLRDVATLAQCIAQDGLSPDMLQRYQRTRRHDQMAITQFTDGLVELYTRKLPGLAAIRSAGLVAFDNIPLLKNVLVRYARGFAGITPDLVCGMPLRGTHESVL